MKDLCDFSDRNGPANASRCRSNPRFVSRIDSTLYSFSSPRILVEKTHEFGSRCCDPIEEGTTRYEKFPARSRILDPKFRKSCHLCEKFQIVRNSDRNDSRF